jgi:hypothetical protein
MAVGPQLSVLTPCAAPEEHWWAEVEGHEASQAYAEHVGEPCEQDGCLFRVSGTGGVFAPGSFGPTGEYSRLATFYSFDEFEAIESSEEACPQ